MIELGSSENTKLNQAVRKDAKVRLQLETDLVSEQAAKFADELQNDFLALQIQQKDKFGQSRLPDPVTDFQDQKRGNGQNQG